MKNAIVKNTVSDTLFEVVKENEDSLILNEVTAVTGLNGETVYEHVAYAPETEMTKKVFDVIGEIVLPAPPEVLASGDVKIFGGKMEIYGEPIECGTLHINKAVAFMPGGLIVEVRAKNGEGVDLKFYDLEKDRFFPLTAGKDSAVLVYQRDEVTGFLVKEEKEAELPADNDDDDATVKTASVDQSLRFYRNAERIGFVPDVFGQLTDSQLDEEKDVLLFVTDDGLKEETDVWGRRVFIPDGASAGEVTRAVMVTVDYDDEEDTVSVSPIARKFNGRVLDTLYGVDGNYVFVTDRDTAVNTNIQGHFYRMASGRDVVDAVRHYPVPVSVDVPVAPKTVFVFATEDTQHLCRITVEKTRDRGYVTKIEEI